MKKTVVPGLLLSSVALWLGLGGVALANDQTISVLGLEPAAGSPESVAAAVTEALRQRVASTAGYRLVQGRDLVEVKLVFSCPDEAPPCMTQAAQSIGATKVIFGNVQPVGTDAFLITLKLLDASRGVVEGWISEQITKAQTTQAALRAPVQKWFGALTGQLRPGTLKVTGGVVGATVWLDGAQAGLLGSDGLTIVGVAPGPHQLVVSKAGYEKFEHQIALASGANEKVAVELRSLEGTEAAPPAAPEASTLTTVPPEPEVAAQSNTGSRVAAWALLGVGLAAVGFGAYSSYVVSDVNSKLDPFRRYPCTQDGAIACGPDGTHREKPLTQQDSDYVKSEQEHLYRASVGGLWRRRRRARDLGRILLPGLRRQRLGRDGQQTRQQPHRHANPGARKCRCDGAPDVLGTSATSYRRIKKWTSTIDRRPHRAVEIGQYRAARRRTRENVRSPRPTFRVESKSKKSIQARLIAVWRCGERA